MSNVKSVDFNDAAKAVGKKAVRSSIQAAVRKGTGKAGGKPADADAACSETEALFFDCNAAASLAAAACVDVAADSA